MKYKYRSHSSRLSTLMVTLGAGTRVEPNSPYELGIAHFMEHMRFKGSKSYSSRELLKKVAYYGGDMNAITIHDSVNYFITIPEENLEHAFDALSSVIFDPIFPKRELDIECDVVCQEIRSDEDDIECNVYQEISKWAFSNSLMYPILGFEETVRNITREDLLKFSNEFYSPEHMLVTLVSRNNYDYLVDKYFGEIDDVFIVAPRSEVKYGPSVIGEIKKIGNYQASIIVSFGSNEIHSLFKDEIASCEVFNMIFGASDDSRLFMRLREELGLVYTIESSIDSNLDGSLFTITTETDPKDKDRVLSIINEEIDKMITNTPNAEELQRAKNRCKSFIYRSLDNSYDTADLMADEVIYGFEIDSKYLAAIDNVTAQDIIRIAQQVFNGYKYIGIGLGTE